ncbi:serine/threonine protein kinase [Pendulispora brunnea]|uniref:Serine/threonine protein kinase n=1 Tax=Pendulispora brunnea TaxID=2905690 RepID=A0ABZ2JYF7_9BACT
MSTNTAESAAGAFEDRRSFSLGRYHLFARLGTGGMADVYLAVARDGMNVTRLAVVKRLRDEQASEPESREMFINEARLAARLNHPNVIQTFEAGSEGGCYFIAMEYVDGQPLSRIIARLKREKRTIDPTFVARICSGALEGLHHAHELTDLDGTPLQMVHRDVSPQNIMVTYDGRVKVLDFGIAKAVGSTQTVHGVFKGKVAFMAPEQLLSEKIDRRADLFSMGICLWEAVTQQRLMAEDTPAKTLLNLMNKEIPRATEINPDVPEKLASVIAKALERDPANRYESAHEMHVALEDFIRSERPVTEQDVRDIVGDLFREPRERLQAKIKAQVAKLSSRGDANNDFGDSQVRYLSTSDGLLDLSDAAEADGSKTKSTALRIGTTSSGVTFTAGAPHIESASDAHPRRASVRGWAGIATAAMLGSGVAFSILLASGIAILRSHHLADRTTAQMKGATETPPIVATVEAPQQPVAPAPAPVHAPESTIATGAGSATTVASAPTKIVPVHPMRPPPPMRATATAAAPAEPPAEGPNVPARATSPSSTPTPATAEPPQGRVFRREL